MRQTSMMSCGILAAGALVASLGAQRAYAPNLGAFARLNESRPILSPQGDRFEAAGVFNPAVVKDGSRFVMLYRAQDKRGISRLGFASSADGVTFTRDPAPVLSPEAEYQLGGGVEDPRLVKIDELYYLTYTAYNGKDAQLALATSRDLRRWDRKGVILPAYKGRWNVNWTKAGAILPQRIGDRYWMYVHGRCPQRARPDRHRLLHRPGHLDRGARPSGATPAAGSLRFAGRRTRSAADPDSQRACSSSTTAPTIGSCIALAGRCSIATIPHACWRARTSPCSSRSPSGKRSDRSPTWCSSRGWSIEPGRWLLYYGAADKYVGVLAAKPLQQPDKP